MGREYTTHASDNCRFSQNIHTHTHTYVHAPVHTAIVTRATSVLRKPTTSSNNRCPCKSTCFASTTDWQYIYLAIVARAVQPTCFDNRIAVAIVARAINILHIHTYIFRKPTENKRLSAAATHARFVSSAPPTYIVPCIIFTPKNEKKHHRGQGGAKPSHPTARPSTRTTATSPPRGTAPWLPPRRLTRATTRRDPRHPGATAPAA